MCIDINEGLMRQKRGVQMRAKVCRIQWNGYGSMKWYYNELVGKMLSFFYMDILIKSLTDIRRHPFIHTHIGYLPTYLPI